ncbi:MAG: FMN-binding protein [Actinobacteria bacterium]|nr:FMN-binding protein [Actinomycetota bacterium]
MKRAVIVGTGTVAGIAAVLALNPDPASQTASAATTKSSTSASSGSSAGSSSGSSSSGSSSAGSSSSGASGTYTGDAVDIGRGYGTIQLEVTVESGRIVDIQALAVPENDHRSAEISSYSVPQLIQQALDVQSAQISGISGATYTSYGFAQSLTSALQQAGL